MASYLESTPSDLLHGMSSHNPAKSPRTNGGSTYHLFSTNAYRSLQLHSNVSILGQIRITVIVSDIGLARISPK